MQLRADCSRRNTEIYIYMGLLLFRFEWNRRDQLLIPQQPFPVCKWFLGNYLSLCKLWGWFNLHDAFFRHLAPNRCPWNSFGTTDNILHISTKLRHVRDQKISAPMCQENVYFEGNLRSVLDQISQGFVYVGTSVDSKTLILPLHTLERTFRVWKYWLKITISC